MEKKIKGSQNVKKTTSTTKKGLMMCIPFTSTTHAASYMEAQEKVGGRKSFLNACAC